MVEQARNKLRAEIDVNKTNAYIKVMGELLLKHLDMHPESAENITRDNKTINGALQKMKEDAQRKKTGNMYMMDGVEAVQITLDYFELNGTPSELLGAMPFVSAGNQVLSANKEAVPKSQLAETKKAVDLNVDFDDFF